MLRSTLALLALVSTFLAAEPPAVHAPNATLEPSDLVEFAKQPPRVQELLTQALALTKLSLTYAYGSSDPANGGMDCSGTMYYLLRNAGFKDVPRDSSSQYAWARKAGGFRAVVSKSAKSFEFDELLPGDLLFWSGTYETSREIPISHVMLYLGTEKKRKTRVMFGASDGRSYDGAQRWGVSVFDFVMPRLNPTDPAKAKVDFVGYARIPALHDPDTLVATTTDASSNSAPEVTSSTTEKEAYDTDKPAPKSSAGSKSKKKSAAAPQSAISNRQSAMPTPAPSVNKKSSEDPSEDPPSKPSTTAKTPSKAKASLSETESAPSLRKKAPGETKTESTTPSKTGGFVSRNEKGTSSSEDEEPKSKSSPKPKQPKSLSPEPTPSPKKKKKSAE